MITTSRRRGHHGCDSSFYLHGVPRGKGPEYPQEYRAAALAGDTRRIKACLRKGTYHSVEEVERTIDVLTVSVGKSLRWYTCPYCGKYHITHKQRRAA